MNTDHPNKRLEGFNNHEIHVIQQALYKYANNKYIAQSPEQRKLNIELMKEFYAEKQRRLGETNADAN